MLATFIWTFDDLITWIVLGIIALTFIIALILVWIDNLKKKWRKRFKKSYKRIPTRTGCIIYDTDKTLEYLYVGDYGKENNIKADFLGYTKKINGVEHKTVDYEDKFVVTISTQKGCPMDCMFCDCPKVGCKGNVSRDELAEEVVNCIQDSKCKHTKRFNLHLARMGEPSFNEDVLDFVQYDLRDLVNKHMSADVIHPVFTTMLPKKNRNLISRIYRWCDIKNRIYDGEAGLQFSINSTDEEQRNKLFRGKSLSLAEISELAKGLPMPKGRKYTLNFPVTKETILDPKELSRLFDKDKWIVKITPIHETKEAVANGIITDTGYYSYDVYEQFEKPLLEEGWQVIVFIPSKEEDEDRITCGNALIAATTLPQRVEVAYSEWQAYKDRAEQHEFTAILMADAIIEAGYRDLQRNWSDKHAESFLRGVAKVLH